ncbi:glycosyltransferase [Cryobacterium sp. PH31-L1]|uniref:glycosyltransferase family 2 protein n=1 Tax=Cryobacterium sp. PH31-L1 TaxID=3046199 RepID=UPI0024BBBE6E|nr:glycosyltransferase [Cryobacterium sp. PH31-L1]MDJ0377158.1 glycosyltransferase [Cryobacterium sp. PH31-L1]
MTDQGRAPLFSILTPVYDTPLNALTDTIASVLAQSFEDWELILVDDLSPNPQVRRVLHDAALRDSRIRVIERSANGGIVAASNDAIQAARGEFLALLDHDDLLTTCALESVAAAIGSRGDVDYVYSDEDKVADDGKYFDQFDKPDWSPERLRGQMYTGHFSVLRAEIVRNVGGFRTEFEGSQDHDLVLRVTEQARQILHVREVLYHWRVVPGSTAELTDNKPYAWDAGVRAVDAHLARVGIAGHATHGPVPGTYRIEREPDLDKSVSIIIPTRGTAGEVWGKQRVFLVDAVKSVLETTRHRDLEIVVVFDADTPSDVLAELAELVGDRLTLVPFFGPFNFSRKCNEGFLAARGEVLLFLNDDVQAISDEMVGNLIAPLNEPDVGMTGAMLYFEDGGIQHAGHLHHMGQFSHAYLGEPKGTYGAFSSLLVNREASGLTAACIAMPREVFQEVGGFSELFPGNFNDVDLSKKVTQSGYRLVWLANVELFHFESRSRNPLVHSFEEKMIIDRWAGPQRDPYLA